MIKTLVELKEGHFQHIGLSECSAASLKKAHAIHPITTVEIEVNLWSYEEETRKGTCLASEIFVAFRRSTVCAIVITTAKELGVIVAAYSPLGRGFLTGTIKSPADLKRQCSSIAAQLAKCSRVTVAWSSWRHAPFPQSFRGGELQAQHGPRQLCEGHRGQEGSHPRSACHRLGHLAWSACRPHARLLVSPSMS